MAGHQTSGDAMTEAGQLYGVGVGPGDPDLMTKKAIDVLARVDVVSFPKTQSGRSMALDIARQFIPADTAHLPFVLPMKTERAPAIEAYDLAASAIATELSSGKSVAVLCEGDPLYYGSFMYLHQRLAGQFDVTVVPGITSLTAAAAVLGQPLAARNDRLKILPAPLDSATLEGEILSADAVAIIKIGRHYNRVRELLDKVGLLSRAHVVSHATLENQTIDRMDRIEPGEQRYFSTILIYRGAEDWADRGQD